MNCGLFCFAGVADRASRGSNPRPCIAGPSCLPSRRRRETQKIETPAKRFVEEGAFVYIFGRRREALDAALAHLGSNARAVRGSVSDLADLDRLFETVKSERGRFDVLFANAGTGELVPLGEITHEHYEQIAVETEEHARELEAYFKAGSGKAGFAGPSCFSSRRRRRRETKRIEGSLAPASPFKRAARRRPF